ncbi:7335_t:CDS:2, partial [Paraglomus occultum]
MDKKGEKETNIQVVVRCRERNEREEKENSPIVVFTGLDARGREVQLRTSPLDKIPNKSFFFDRVFGPDANQQIIYQETVVPILEEASI